MSMLKRTYALPPDTVLEFERTVAPGQRSSVIAQLIKDWVEERERAELRRLVIEGCQEMAEISLELERDFHPLEEEVHRSVEY